MYDGQSRGFVGRHKELDELSTALAEAERQHGALWVITGEAGVGKSSLTAEFAARATSAGARVLWGRCRELQGTPPYWPWIQVLRPLLEPGTGEGTAAGRERLADLVPAPGRSPAVSGARGQEPDRFQFFDAVSRFLAAAAERQTLVLIFEDMHAADAASLLLLRFVAEELTGARVLLIATSRPHPEASTTDDDLDPGLDVSLHGTSSRSLRLHGLSPGELTVLLERWGLSEEVLPTVWQRTGGNPFFAIEVARSLATRTTPIPDPRLVLLPPGVRRTLVERLSDLTEPARETLALAAVSGREFPLDLISLCSGMPADRVDLLLTQAVRVGVLDRLAIHPVSYRFAHDLLREAVYVELAPERRMCLHGDVGRALVRLYGPSTDEHLEEISRHFLAAAPLCDQSQAVDFAVRAGRRAAADLAYEQAGELFDKALQLVRQSDPPEARLECEIELDAGHAQLRSGRPDEAKRLFLAAARRAEHERLPDLLARATLGYGGQWSFTGETADARLVQLLETALRHLPEQEHLDLRARLLARLAEELYHSPDHEPAEELSARAVELARRLDDPPTLGRALLARLFVLWRPSGPDRLQERLELDAQVLALAAVTHDAELELDGRAWRISDLLEAGDVVGAQEHMASFARTAEGLRQPFYLWFVEVFAALRTLMQGHYSEAEQHAEAALGIGRRAQGERELLENAIGAHTIHTLLIRREHSRHSPVPDGEPASAVDSVLDTFPRQPAWRAAMGLRLLALGQEARARAHYETLAAQEFRVLLMGDASLIAISLTAELAATFGDADQIGQLRGVLGPFAGRHVVIGHPAMAYQGCVDLYLGLLALATGAVEEALAHLQEASRRHAAMGATPWVARADYHRARGHLLRAADGDHAAATHLLDRAQQIATELRMAPLLRDITELRRAKRPPGEGEVPGVEPATRRQQQSAVFIRDGDVWTVALGPETTRISDLKGMGYLQRLLAEPEREFHALDLSTSTFRETGSGAIAQADGLRLDSGDAGPLLDEQAKRAYRVRLQQLRAEESDAEEMGHSERADRAREEIDALAHELARAVGLGGRDRRAASQSERARVNVSRAIRAAIDRITQHAPSLGHHLDTTVRTGIYCVYLPDPNAVPQWRTTQD